MSQELEQRIAAALTDDVTSDAVRALLTETEVAIAEADAAADEERAKALDVLRSPDPLAARDAMQSAEFARDGLRALLPRLQTRFVQTEFAERQHAWQATADALQTKRDALAAELAEVYSASVNRIFDLLTRAEAIDSEIGRLGSAPNGMGALAAITPRELRELKLPRWQGSAVWPPYRPLDVTMIVPAMPHHGGAWWLELEQRAAAHRAEQERLAAYYETQAREREQREQAKGDSELRNAAHG